MFLNCHTYYSLNYGVMSVSELVEAAASTGIRQLALTDINNTSCAIEFLEKCLDHDIEPVVGIDFRENTQPRYLGLAKSAQGFALLNQLLNQYMVQGIPLPREAPALEDVFFIYDVARMPVRQLRKDEFVGVRPNEIFQVCHGHQLKPDRLVCLLSVTLPATASWELHRLLRCIDLNTILSKLNASSCCQPDEYLRDPKEVARLYATQPFLVRNTKKLLDACCFSLPKDTNPNLSIYLHSAESDFQLLLHLAYDGLQKRYPLDFRDLLPRLEKELMMIHRLHFTAYFLITWDIIQFAICRDFSHVGRGSGANSLVAYCLFITDVDPVALNLYFERFINPYRPVPPDFDLDFCWDQRDEVLRYLQRRYGHDRVGILATYQTYKGKSVVRELGKVLGLDRRDIDMIVRFPLMDDKHHPLARKIFSLGKNMLSLPSHLSIHAGGVVITAGAITNITSSQMMPKGFAVAQIDMHHASQWGLHKYDILSQRGTSHIRETIEIIQQVKKVKIDISDMTTISGDQETLQMLATPGAAIGCFYIESPAMRGLLTKVPCRSYQDLIAVSSIIRPGVAKSGMMQEYIVRFHEPGRIIFLHPIMQELLSETFGIMVYQEDVMKVVHHIGGFDLFESDQLRRLMTGKNKNRDELLALMDRFMAHTRMSGIDTSLAQELWRQIESFSGYSFCKAHSATYAAESMQSLYLKTHFPIEFMVAVINNRGGFYPMEVYIRELVRLGASIEMPCLVHSSWVTRISHGKVYLGFSHIKGVTRQTGEALLSLRSRSDHIRKLDQVIGLVAAAQLDLLIEAGVFRTLEKVKSKLLFERLLLSNAAHVGQLQIFATPNFRYQADVDQTEVMEAQIQMRLLGFTLSTPFILFESLPYASLHLLRNKGTGENVMIIGYYVLEKPVTTDDGRHMCFATWYDQDLVFFDTVHFAEVLRKYPLKGKGVYEIKGTIEWHYGYPQIMVYFCRQIAALGDRIKTADILTYYEYLRLTEG